ncbi:MAG: glycosyltransferase family 39 protein [Candidatus Eremiobacteraeota bacterium]|nr:glycosyltransferase family 39 protein [Candidatus Eremiobacteraeota bacterium]
MRLSWVAYAWAAVAIALHLAFNHRYNYYRDEFYFIDCAKHLAWGYVDQPPLAPLIAWLSTPWHYALWALRFPLAVLSGVTVLAGCLIARELRGGIFAQGLTGLVLALAPGYLGQGYALSTEFLTPLSWSALIWLTMRLVATRNPRLYLAMAAVIVVGLYAKYSIATLAIALAFALICTRHAKLARSWYLPLSAALAVLLVLPNLAWQHAHGWPILEVVRNDQLNRHALANGIAVESPNLALNALYFIVMQVVYQNPVLSIIWIWGLVALVCAPENAPYRYLALSYGLLFVFMVLTVARGYYLEGFYPALFAAGSVAVERALRTRPAWIRPAVLAGAALVAAFMAPLALPIFPLPTYMKYEAAIGLSRPAPPDGKRHLIDPMYADQMGWEGMTQTVAGVYNSLPQNVRSRTAIFADRYAYAGAIDFYGPRYRLPPAISPNNSYYLWGTRGYSGEPMIAVGATDYHLLLGAFGSVRQVAVYRNELRWMLEGPLPIYLCTRPRAPLAVLWPRFKYYGL